MDLKGGRGKERVFGEGNGKSISGSSSRTDSKTVMVDNYGNNVREGVKGLRFEQRGAAIETEFVEKHTRISQFPTDNWISGDETEMNVSRCMSVVSSVEDISAHLMNFAGSVRSRESMDQFQGVERDRFDGFYVSPMVGAQRGRMPTSAYPDEGPSTYKVDSFDGTSEVENLEQDRAELLRKLDELKEKLSRSYDVADKPGELVPMERSRTPPDPYGNLLTCALSMQPYAVDKQMTRPPYFNYSHGPVTFTKHHNMVMQHLAELLRKLDELKEKLSRSYDVADKPSEPVPMERSRTPPDPYGNLLTCTLSMQPYAVDEQMTRPPYFNYSHGPVTFTKHHNMVMQQKNFYPPQRHPWNAIPENEDPSQQQMKQRPPHHPLQYPRPPPNEKFMGQRMEFNANPHENASHSPACSCSGCYNPNWLAPPQVPLDDFGNRRVPKSPINLNSNHHVNPVTFLPHVYNPQRASPPPLHTRWQSDFDSEPRTAMAINKRRRIFHPVAGGAPFITCFRCFEILKLPRKLENMNKNQSKLQCGSCSTVISLEIKNKKLFTSKVSKQQSSEVGQSSNEALKGSTLSPRGSPNAGDTKCPCDDLDHSDHTLPFIDTEVNLLTEDQKLDVDESEKRQGPTSTSSIASKEEEEEEISDCVIAPLDVDESEKRRGPTSTSSIPSKEEEEEEEEISDCVIAPLDVDESVKRQGLTSTSSVPSKEEEEEISDCVIANTDVSGSAELPTKESFSPKRPGSPLWEQSDSSKHTVSGAKKGNDSDCTNQDKALFRKIASRQNSVKDSSVETNVDVSYNEYLNTNISKDSAEGRKEQDRPKIGKGADSLLVGLIKKSSRDISKSNQAVEKTRPTVFINGQPIPDHVVRKAEKLAGPIQPGDYWYDFRAGFWGVMGQACLGIIPPFIEEFYYPIPKNCAAGNTGVYVNGRELHQRDLDLLARRGLPTTREKFYIVEMSGRVVDEDSGEDLKSLGKLAPTIEKAKRGFGMKVPRMVV